MENNNRQTEDFGALVGIIIVVIVLLVGAFYFVNQRIEKSKEFQASIQQSGSTSSDEISSIESDTNSMNFDNLDVDVNSL